MAQINKPTDYFNTKLYTGNGTDDHAITGVGFQPDWVWIKDRDSAYNHGLFDVVRGATKILSSNATSAEATTEGVKSFDSDGFTLGTGAFQNNNNDDFVSWNWLAGGTASSNTDGSITSSVSANTTAGFSIVSFTGTGANATVGHGLSSAPELIFFKNRENGTQEWDTYAEPIGATKFLQLNSAAAANSTNAALRFNSTAPTSSVFSVGTATTTNESADGIIAYCVHSVKGYSKIGSYSGNLSDDGTFVYTGFAPAFVLIKSTTAATSWIMFDNKREPSNPTYKRLHAELSDAEYTSAFGIDMLSNGFKLRTSNNSFNHANTYMYMAFAAEPLVGTNNIPATAR